MVKEQANVITNSVAVYLRVPNLVLPNVKLYFSQGDLPLKKKLKGLFVPISGLELPAQFYVKGQLSDLVQENQYSIFLITLVDKKGVIRVENMPLTELILRSVDLPFPDGKTMYRQFDIDIDMYRSYVINTLQYGATANPNYLPFQFITD